MTRPLVVLALTISVALVISPTSLFLCPSPITVASAQEGAQRKIDPQKPSPADLAKLPPPKAFVDASLRPKMKTVPGIDRGPVRRVGSITDASRIQADFVLNELVVATDDMAQLARLVNRLGGRVLKTLDFSNIKLKHGDMKGVPKLHLVHVDASQSDISKLTENLRKIDPLCRGELRFSHESGIQLLAAGADEAANHGLKVSLNWLRYRASLPEGNTVESPGTAAGYRRDAFQWPYMNRGSLQNIGVGSAWLALAAADKLRNRIRIMVADGGFLINDDLPAWRAHAGVDDWGVRDYFSGDPWHGTKVVGTAMARLDNRFGIAGPAGPVAELVAVSTGSDFFSFFGGFFGFLAGGFGDTDIITISSAGRIPAAATLFLGVDTFENLFFGALRAGGTLVFAAAGNAEPGASAEDVDEEDCVISCWEEAAWLPCEASGVICVGGMAWNTSLRHSGSNWASKTEDASIDIWGPFEVWGYRSAGGRDYTPTRITGTSFATPFVAGVAALVWAANPELSATEVWRIMRDTAHRGGVGGPRLLNDLRVNAFGAVKRALGDVNSRPFIRVEPAPGSTGTVQLNRAVALVANAVDAEDGIPCCRVTWTPHETFSTGTAHYATFVFDTVGWKPIIATATDLNGETQSSLVMVEVRNSEPVAHIEQPLPRTHVYQGEPMHLLGSATDLNEGPGPGAGNIDCASLRWTSIGETASPTRGCEATITFSSLGPRTITLMATDPEGASAYAHVGVIVSARPDNLPPTISLGPLPPINYGEGYRLDQPFVLTAWAEDAEGNLPIRYEWVAVSYQPGRPLVSAAARTSPRPDATGHVEWRPEDSLFLTDCSDIRNLSGQWVTLTLEATDSLGNRSSKFFANFKMYRCVGT